MTLQRRLYRMVPVKLAETVAQYEYKGTHAKAHHWVTRLFHWSTAILLIYGIVRNAEVTGALSDEQLMLREVAFSMTVGGSSFANLFGSGFLAADRSYRRARLRGSVWRRGQCISRSIRSSPSWSPLGSLSHTRF